MEWSCWRASCGRGCRKDRRSTIAELVTLHPERFLVAERIREQVLRHTRDELPFATAVLIDSWEDDPQRELVRILATILVEREGQRAIVIGRDGSLIKTISTAARQDLEEFLGRQVFLRATVRCEPRWRESRGILDLLEREAVAVDLSGTADARRSSRRSRGSAGETTRTDASGLSMRILSGEAILLDAIDLHERDRVVTFLTAEWGRKRGVARGARAKYSRFAGQLQPLSKVAVRWFEKEGRDLVRIESVELIEPCRALLEDLDGILLASYLAEHLVVLRAGERGLGVLLPPARRHAALDRAGSRPRPRRALLRGVGAASRRHLPAAARVPGVRALAGGRRRRRHRPRRPRDPLPRLRRRSRGQAVGGRGRVPAADRARGAAGDRGRRRRPPPSCARSSAPAPRCAPASCTRSCAATR